jgi:hypothetical protein
LKKLFQSREFGSGEVEEMSEAEADVVTWRQSEGVKKDDGVVVGVLLFDKEGRVGFVWRAVEETCRFEAKA